MTKFKYELAGQRFGRLVVISRSHPGKASHQYWLCQCDCGNQKRISQSALVSDRTRSCGCLRKEVTAKRLTRHGHTRGGRRTPAHSIWNGMLGRCLNPNSPAYKDYGGRGITVDPRWLQFENFFADMGQPPSGATLDRIDNNKGYAPDNCRWATKKEQANNRRSCRLITVNGLTMTVKQWAELQGLNCQTIGSRLRSGWDPVETVLTPSKPNQYHPRRRQHKAS